MVGYLLWVQTGFHPLHLCYKSAQATARSTVWGLRLLAELKAPVLAEMSWAKILSICGLSGRFFSVNFHWYRKGTGTKISHLELSLTLKYEGKM